MNVVSATNEDVPGIIEVLKVAWLGTYINEQIGVTKEKIEELFNDFSDRSARWQKRIDAKDPIYVIKKDNTVLGVAAPKIEGGKHRVGALYVHPDAQGMGVGKALLEQVLELYKEHPVYLDVVTYNKKAQDFYEHMGFQFTGETVDMTIERVGVSLPNYEMIYKREK